MNSKDKYEVLIDTYSNQTKMKIIFLLAENEEMTVTQMSSHIDVSRSNLYHAVKQMVQNGILKEPSVRPKDNYVEKFYSLNQEFFGTIDWENLAGSFGTLSTEQVRNLFRSVLMSYAFNLMMLSEKLEYTDPETIDNLKSSFINQAAITLYSSTHVGSYPKAEEHLKKVMDEFGKPSIPADDRPRLRIMILSLPYI